MQVPVQLLPKGGPTLQLELFEFAPGVKVSVPVPRHLPRVVPRTGIVKMVQEPDGRFRPEIESLPAVVPLKNWDEKTYGVSKFIISALVLAGFVEGERIAPRYMTIVLESWFAYRELIRQNPYFWQDADNRDRYQKAQKRLSQQWKAEDGPETAQEEGLFSTAVETPESAENVSRPRRQRQKPAGETSPPVKLDLRNEPPAE